MIGCHHLWVVKGEFRTKHTLSAVHEAAACAVHECHRKLSLQRPVGNHFLLNERLCCFQIPTIVRKSPTVQLDRSNSCLPRSGLALRKIASSGHATSLRKHSPTRQPSTHAQHPSQARSVSISKAKLFFSKIGSAQSSPNDKVVVLCSCDSLRADPKTMPKDLSEKIFPQGGRGGTANNC